MINNSHINPFKYLIKSDNAPLYDSISVSLEIDDDCVVLNRYFFIKSQLRQFLIDDNYSLDNFRMDYCPILFSKNRKNQLCLYLYKKIRQNVDPKGAKLFCELDPDANSLNDELNNRFYSINNERFEGANNDDDYKTIIEKFAQLRENMNRETFKKTNMYHKMI